MNVRGSLALAVVCLIATISGCSTAGSNTTSTTPVTPVTAVVVSSVSPAKLAAGAAATTLTITGSGFTSTSSVQVGGALESTTFVSATQLTALVPASQLASGGMLSIIAASGSASSASGTAVNLEIDNPAAVITQSVPATLLTGTPSTTVALLGTGFVPTTIVQVSGSARPTAYVSPTQLNVVLTAADVATSGSLSLSAVNPAPGGGTSVAAVVPVANLTVTSIAPAKLTAGAGLTTLTVSGTGFSNTTSVQVAGALVSTTFISPTQLTAVIPAAQLANGAMLSVIATSSGVSSSAATLEVDNPSPTITQFVPTTLTAGSPSTAVSVLGTGFVTGTVGQINGSSRATAYVSPTQLNIFATSADLAASGALSLTAMNAAPGGGTSAAASIPVNNPLPGAITVAPSTVPTGGTAPVTITVTGSNFLPTSTVLIGTSSRTTTFVSPTQLTFQLTVADQAAAARLLITVVNPAPVGGASPAAGLTIAAPTPTPVLTSVTPASLVVGSAATAITVSGSNLTAGSTVLWNGTALVTSYFTNGYGISLIGGVPASLIASVGTANVTVSSPTATPAISNPLSVSITNPPSPTLTALSPSVVPINTAATITLTGTGFTSASTVSFNGTSIAATYVSATSLTVAVPASSLSIPGNDSFVVSTPAPGGGTSAALNLTAYVPIVNNSMIYNPVNGLFYLSIPSSVGAPYGNSIVSLDPATGAFGVPIFVGSEPNKLALTSDGRYLWVGLDGASAVRKVDLVAATAGLQFSFGGNSGVYDNPPTAVALVALPGATDSVVVGVSTGSATALRIYDSGVARGSVTSGYYSAPYALLADGTRNEIYAGVSGTYNVYTYSSAGLTLKTTATAGTYASSTADEFQIAGGRLYTDFGTVGDPESGSLLGTFYLTGTTAASGPTTADTTLGKAFILDSPTTSFSTPTQIQIFSLSNFAQATTAVIPVSVATPSSYSYFNNYPSRLTRWGTNGLAFRTPSGVYSVRSNLVKDLSTTSADLGVTLANAGPNTTSANTTYTATILNAGPSASTNIAFTAQIPSSAVLVSASSPAGACAVSTIISCDLGGLASGTSTTVSVVVTQTTPGSAVFNAQVSGSESDPTLSNNQATSNLTIAGSPYNLAPVVTSISPASIQAGASDTVLTVAGTGFSGSSVIVLGSISLPTNVVSSTKLTATIPAASLTTLGWAPVSVTTPAPGGGRSAQLPLSIFNVITLGVNHILYDPYSRKIMASVGSGSTAIASNSIVAITPETSTVGTPVSIGSQPTKMALTSDGQILYTILSGSQSIARFNMLTQAADFTANLTSPYSYFGLALRDIAALPGTETTAAVDLGEDSGNAIYDFNTTARTATMRGSATSSYTGSCLAFLDTTNLLSFDIDTTGATLNKFPVTSTGLSGAYNSASESTLNSFGCFKLSGSLAFANAGGVADPSTSPATQVGIFTGAGSGGTFSTLQALAPDASLKRAFFLASTTGSTSSTFDGLSAFDQNTFLKSAAVTLNVPTIEGASATYTGVDLIRWGQDGLAMLTSGGHLYLLRGPFVVPQLLNTNTAATLTSSSASTLTHGTGNTLLTLTGSNFVPGVAVTLGGVYRTTTIVDATHITVAIPASDLTSTGALSLTATNPGAPASSPLSIPVN